MWNRFPYYGFLLLAIVLFATAWGMHTYEEWRYNPRLVVSYLERKIEKANAQIVEQAAPLVLSNDEDRAIEAMGVFRYKGEQLVAWSTNKYVIELKEASIDSYKLVSKGFLQLLVIAKKPLGTAAEETIVYTLPLIEQYSITNKHLTNGVIGLKEATQSYVLSEQKAEEGLMVRLPGKQAPLYLSFDPEEANNLAPHTITWLLLLVAGVTMLGWSFTISAYVGRRYKKEWGFILLFLLLAAPVIFIYTYGFPIDMGLLPLFGPELFASNAFTPSLGHMSVVVVLFTTLIAYLINQRVFTSVSQLHGALVKVLWAIFISALSAALYAFMQYNIFTLVFDSGVSLQITRFSSLSIYSFICITIIAILYAAVLSLIAHLNVVVYGFRLPITARFLIRVLSALIIFYTFNHLYRFDEISAVWATRDYKWITTGWFVLYLFLVDELHVNKNEIKLFGGKIIFWAVFVSASITGLVFFFNNLKERDLRENFAERLTDSRDEGYEWDFVQIGERIESDTTLAAMLDAGGKQMAAYAEQYLRENYFAASQNLYTYHFFIEHSSHNPIVSPEDSAVVRLILRELLEGQPTASRHLYYNSHQDNRANYVAAISPRLSNNRATGRILLCSHAKEPGQGNLYLEVLSPSQNNLDNLLPYYSYAIYIKGKQIYHNDGYPFPTLLPKHITKQKRAWWSEHATYSSLWLHTKENTTIAVVAADNKVWTFITLFSYFFSSLLLAGILLQMTRSLLNYIVMRRRNRGVFLIPFTSQVNFALLGVVVISLLVIAMATRYFIKQRHDESIRNRYYSTKGILESKIQYQLYQGNSDSMTLAHLTKLVSSLAADYNVNIDLYDNKGSLLASSHPELQFLGLRSNKIDYPTFVTLSRGKANVLFRENSIGTLSYLTLFSTVKDDKGNILAYINLPYYRYQSEIQSQLDSIVLAMVNIYTLIFLVVAFAAVYFTRGMARTLNFIIEKFETISLNHNTLKEWTRRDEIGRLMRAYNKMAIKLQENAAVMKTHERESAWREMAQQVAHEIKNPLTPMKLNIQYLSKLIDENPERAHEKGPKLLGNLLHQIDHLTRIASDFSDFAKLPKVAPERLHLQKVVEPTIALFREEGIVSVTFEAPPKPIFVWADASHITRVFTNLLQNAIQAMADNETGIVEVKIVAQDMQAIITVRDNGQGMNKEVKQKIFQPHFTTKSSGTGLGLAMTKRIIEESNGTISFVSEEGRGTTFTITLPLINREP